MTLSLALSIVLCFVSVSIAVGQRIAETKMLADRLMANYSKHIVPSENAKDPFRVSVYVDLLAVGEIDEIEEKLSTVMRLNYMWQDDSMQWDAEEMNISLISLSWTDVWTPIFRVANPHSDSSDGQYTDSTFDTVIYMSFGYAFFDEMRTTKTTCNLDMTYYPFDIQKCYIIMSIMGNRKYSFNLKATMVHLDQAFLMIDNFEHGSWKCIGKDIIVGGNRSNGEFAVELVFERRPLFVLLHILLPTVILAMLTPIVFLLPKNSGERVGYSITMVLAISVYMTIVSDNLPNNSTPMPIISIMIFTWYIIDALIVVCVVSNTIINTAKNQIPVPTIARHFVQLTRLLRFRKRPQATGISDETRKCIDSDIDSEKEDLNKDDDTCEETKECHIHGITWQEVSHCIDRWCLVLSYTLKIMLPIVIFIFKSTN